MSSGDILSVSCDVVVTKAGFVSNFFSRVARNQKNFCSRMLRHTSFVNNNTHWDLFSNLFCRSKKKVMSFENILTLHAMSLISSLSLSCHFHLLLLVCCFSSTNIWAFIELQHHNSNGFYQQQSLECVAVLPLRDNIIIPSMCVHGEQKCSISSVRSCVRSHSFLMLLLLLLPLMLPQYIRVLLFLLHSIHILSLPSILFKEKKVFISRCEEKKVLKSKRGKEGEKKNRVIIKYTILCGLEKNNIWKIITNFISLSLFLTLFSSLHVWLSFL